MDKTEIACVLLFIAIVFVAILDLESRKKFIADNNCVVVSKESDSTGLTVTGNGQVGMVLIPGKTGYKCDDGIVYHF